MPSKKRGGLSKREYAAAQKAKPKVSARKTVAKMTGIGPVANGQQYSDMVGASQGKFVGPYAPSFYDNAQKSNPNKATFKSPSKPSSKSNRQKVANQQTIASAAPTAGDTYKPDLLDKASNWLQEKSPLHRAVGTAAGNYVDTGDKWELAKVMAPFAAGAAIPVGMFAAGAGAAGSGMSALAGAGRSAAGRGATNLFKGVGRAARTAGDDIVSRTSTIPITAATGATGVGGAALLAGGGQIIGTGGHSDPTIEQPSEDDYIPRSTPREDIPSDDRSLEDRGASPMPDGWNDEASDYWKGQETAQESPVADLIAEMQPEMRTEEFPQDGSMQYPGGTTRNRSGRGNGAFGTGKGIQGDDPYLQEMRKSMKGYEGMEKDVRQQFEELIKALDPTYDQYRKEGETELNNQLNTDLTKLAAVMNANNTGDSEQRAQMMAGQQTTNRGLLANLLEKLAQQKNQDITGYKTKSIDAVNSIREKGMGARERLAQMMKQVQDDQWDRQYKMDSLNQKGSGGSSSAGSVTYIGNNAAGEPVYRNTKTGATMVGSGLKRGGNALEDAMAALLKGQQGGGQGGSWEIDPTTGEQVWVID